MIKNYYHVLGIETTTTIDEVKQVYRRHAVKFHPDKHEGDKFFEEKFKEVITIRQIFKVLTP